MDEARKLAQQFKDSLALEKYMRVLEIQPKNVLAAVKCAEINCAFGAKQTNEEGKKKYYGGAKSFASRALQIDSFSADANYVNAVVYGKLTEVDKKNETVVEVV